MLFGTGKMIYLSGSVLEGNDLLSGEFSRHAKMIHLSASVLDGDIFCLVKLSGHH